MIITAWDDTKQDGISNLPASEYNTMVSAIKNQGSGYYIYLSGTTYYAKNLDTGAIDSNGNVFETVVNGCINNFANSGRIILGPYTYNLSANPIDFGLKTITLEGTAYHFGLLTYATRITCSYGFADYFIKLGSLGNSVYGSQIRNMELAGGQKTTPLGGISMINPNYCIVENILFNDFFNQTNPSRGIYTYGEGIAYGQGSYYNIFSNLVTRRCAIGIEVGPVVNSNIFIGGNLGNSGTGQSWTVPIYGYYFNGGGGNTIIGTDLEAFPGTNSIACYITNNASGNTFCGLRCEGNYRDIVIDAGGSSGGNSFFGGSTSSTVDGFLHIIDNGARKSTSYGTYNHCIENWGTATITAGTSIVVPHYLGYYPWDANSGFTPATVQVIPTSDIGSGVRYWVDTVGVNTFTINTSSTVTKTFYWYVRK